MLRSFDHVLIAVRDLRAAATTYEGLLGRRCSWRGAHPGMGTENVLFKLDNAYVELLSPTSPGPVAEMLEERLEGEGEGLAGMAFGTDDAEACAKALRECGLSVSPPQQGQGRDLASGATRRWRNVLLSPEDMRGLTVFAIQHLSPADALPDVDPQSASGVIAGIDHIVINTVDPEGAIQLYRDCLGIRLALDRSFESRGLRLIFFRIGGVTVEFSARADAPETSDSPDRFFGLAYQTPDIRATRDRIAASGFEVSDVRAGNKPGTLVCTVRRETCGVPTLLIGPDPES